MDRAREFEEPAGCRTIRGEPGGRDGVPGGGVRSDVAPWQIGGLNVHRGG